MSKFCCSETMPLPQWDPSGKLSSAEYDAIFEERQRRFAAYAERSLHRSRGVPIIAPLGHDQTGPTKGKGAIGREESGVLKRVVVLSDGSRRHRTIPTQIGVFGTMVAGAAYENPTRSE